ncbi:hypothetical protein HDU78_010471 [Chytriomyces hyalinus]|nr:hypothetical protein HDU78_010471 [Chytriomyces hyalinus]
MVDNFSCYERRQIESIKLDMCEIKYQNDLLLKRVAELEEFCARAASKKRKTSHWGYEPDLSQPTSTTHDSTITEHTPAAKKRPDSVETRKGSTSEDTLKLEVPSQLTDLLVDAMLQLRTATYKVEALTSKVTQHRQG